MHPISTLKMWTHEHHEAMPHEFPNKILKWTHGEYLWIMVGIILWVGLMILMIYATLRMEPSDIINQFQSPPNYFNFGPGYNMGPGLNINPSIRPTV